MKLSTFAVNHPAVIIIFLLSLLLFSGLAFVSTPIAFIPDVTVPTYHIITTYPGADGERVNDEVTLLLEKKLATISSLDSIECDSNDSVSLIQLKFTEDVNGDTILPVIREKINEIKADLPDGISGDPYIIQVEASRAVPIFSFSIKSSMDADGISLFAENTLIPVLSSIKGVAELEVLGNQKSEVRITLDLGKIEALGLSILKIQQIIANNNLSLPAGQIEYRGKNLVMETGGELKSVKSASQLLVGSHMGSSIYLGDIAKIELAPPIKNNLFLGDGEETIIIKIYRRSGEDVLKIIKEAKKILNQIKNERSDISDFYIIQDESRVTFNAVYSISRSLIFGVILAFLVIFLFLKNIRFALYIATSIPLSILFSLIGIKLFDLSINVLTLSGLTVAIGMIVDASIVIMENIHAHLLSGEDKKTASIKGAMEMASAVLASALTTISVFFPMLFLTGIMGIFFGNIAITIILSLTASLIVSLMVIPFITAHLSGALKLKSDIYRKNGLMDRLGRLYGNALEIALNKKGALFLFAVLVLFISLLSIKTLGMTVFPSMDTGEIEIRLEYPSGFTLEKSKEKTLEVQAFIRQEVKEVKTMVFEVTAGEAAGSIVLSTADQRDHSTHEINQIMTRRINNNIVDVKALLFNGGLDSIIAEYTGGRGYIVDLYSPKWEELVLASQTVVDVIRQDPSIYYVKNSAELNNLKLIFDLDPLRLGQLGLSAMEAGATATIIYLGETTGSFRDGDDLRDITLISNLNNQPLFKNNMNRMYLVNPVGSNIPYSSFSDFHIEQTAKKISRENRLYHSEIAGYFFGEDVTAINRRINRRLNEVSFYSTITRGTGGMAGMLAEELPPVLLVLAIAIFLVYAVMVIQFEMFRQPLIIMAAYPFCLIGLVFGLQLFGSVLSLIAFLGVIALAGVEVNNAIIIVDYTNQLRSDSNISLRNAVINGCKSRLQPILMTTLTTMLGVLPMAAGRGNGAEMYAPLGQVILGGMLTSTFITLFFIPALYEYLEQQKL